MKEILVQYTSYNIWANQLIADLLIKQEQLLVMQAMALEKGLIK